MTDRRRFLLATPAAALAGCVVVGGDAGPPAPAPVYRVGDRWTYRGKDGYRSPIEWEETRELTSVVPEGFVFRITQKGPHVDTERTERLSAPGIVTVGAVFDDETRVFGQPLERYRFPLTQGASWRQSLPNYLQNERRDDPLLRSTTVGGWEKVTTPAGTFDAILLRIFMQLNLNDPFRWPTQCNYVFAWAPAVGATVREERYATYRERGDMNSSIEFRAQNSVLELLSFQRGNG